MLLTLRRQGIRNFPNGERVALFTNPQLNISLAVPYDYHTGSLKPSNVKSIKEDSDEENDFEDIDDRRKELVDFYDKLNNKTELSDLEKALFNWLSSEIDEYGDFEEMENEILDDVYDDYKALTESVVIESVIHHLNRITNTGQEEEVKFANGETLRVHPVTAKSVLDLYNKVNDGNQRKISQTIQSGSAGLVKVADFAQEQLKRGNN